MLFVSVSLSALPPTPILHTTIPGVSGHISHLLKVSLTVQGEAGLESRLPDLKAPGFTLQAVLILYYLG